MEKSNYLNTEENDVNLFKYSDVDLVNFIKEKNKVNSIMLSQEFQNKNETSTYIVHIYGIHILYLILYYYFQIHKSMKQINVYHKNLRRRKHEQGKYSCRVEKERDADCPRPRVSVLHDPYTGRDLRAIQLY